MNKASARWKRLKKNPKNRDDDEKRDDDKKREAVRKAFMEFKARPKLPRPNHITDDLPST